MSDLFEEIGKRITDIAEDIGKRTEDTIEVQKIKGKIRSLKRANERDFIDIGRMVYEKFRNGEVADMDYIALCENIEKRDEEIVKHKEEIQGIKEEL